MRVGHVVRGGGLISWLLVVTFFFFFFFVQVVRVYFGGVADRRSAVSRGR
jgi:hypothetical protein